MDRKIRDLRKKGIKRPKQIKKSGDIILIACQGTKTEPQYFQSLRKEWLIRSSQIRIFKKAYDPKSLVEEVLELKKEYENDKEIKIDEVWCVFDHEGCNKDKHFEEAVNQAKDNEIKIASSNPCFEVWYLLHFEPVKKPFEKYKDVEKDLKKHLKGYDKSANYFSTLYPNTKFAIDNAEALRKHNDSTDSACPATDVDLLVKKMKEMSNIY